MKALDFLIRNLVTPVIVAVAAAAITYYAFSDRREATPDISAVHTFVNVKNLDRIVSGLIIERAVNLSRGQQEEIEPESTVFKEKFKSIREILDANNFDELVNTSIHELEIRNNSGNRASNIEFINKFSYSLYVYSEIKDKEFHRIPPNDRYKIDHLDPGDVIFLSGFSRYSIQGEINVVILQDGKRIIPTSSLFPEYEFYYLNLIYEHAFLFYIVFVSGLIFIFAILISIINLLFKSINGTNSSEDKPAIQADLDKALDKAEIMKLEKLSENEKKN